MSASETTFDVPGVPFDDLGPRRVVVLHDPGARLHAVVVVDSITGGPAGGGVRMTPDVTIAEIARLARAMTYKYALLSMPVGGAKAGIRFDPSDPARADVVRAFLEAAKPLIDAGVFVPGPDMGTTATDFASSADLHLDEQLTGYGVVAAAKSAAQLAGRSLEGARVAIEGFGKVGTAAARFFVREGAKVVAVSTVRAALTSNDGLDVERLVAVREQQGEAALERAPGVTVQPREALFAVKCDVLVPGARPDAIHRGNVDAIEASLVVPGSNVPYAEGTLEALHARGVVAIPDFVANAGGVLATICALQGLDESTAHGLVGDLIGRNVQRVMKRAQEKNVHPYAAAIEIAREQIANR
ncbi:Glu/Leu/Phe/Val family dehydrogenase [Sandaracinus amylolyticus]|uniref:Glutamate dehydrogenase n=1 Tax=Sandaracinus amylolyticus TaxID=927083 RepID=A0A0F6WAM6_9BACT|nr:Glu/Leu/Phe/Val dehydrogenase dimerization domain-containing protein [Sandaracinus amylolyticus]AKF11640.1 NAD-specific glutamate dehydrogenase [Sandaracinus amylolyticus]